MLVRNVLTEYLSGKVRTFLSLYFLENIFHVTLYLGYQEMKLYDII